MLLAGLPQNHPSYVEDHEMFIVKVFAARRGASSSGQMPREMSCKFNKDEKLQKRNYLPVDALSRISSPLQQPYKWVNDRFMYGGPNTARRGASSS
jgi:hypothetical protein